MLVNKATERQWAATDFPGIERQPVPQQRNRRPLVGRAARARVALSAPCAQEPRKWWCCRAPGASAASTCALATTFHQPGEEHDVVAVTDATDLRVVAEGDAVSG
jgi:hypothetical protein